jgi:GTPase SAR1 family protein
MKNPLLSQDQLADKEQDHRGCCCFPYRRKSKHRKSHDEITGGATLKRVCFIGDVGTGKTTMRHLLSDENDDVYTYEPTIGVDFTAFNIDTCRIHLWDVGGMPKISKICKPFIEQADVVILFILLNAERLEGSWIDHIKTTQMFNNKRKIYVSFTTNTGDTDDVHLKQLHLFKKISRNVNVDGVCIVNIEKNKRQSIHKIQDFIQVL